MITNENDEVKINEVECAFFDVKEDEMKKEKCFEEFQGIECCARLNKDTRKNEEEEKIMEELKDEKYEKSIEENFERDKEDLCDDGVIKYHFLDENSKLSQSCKKTNFIKKIATSSSSSSKTKQMKGNFEPHKEKREEKAENRRLLHELSSAKRNGIIGNSQSKEKISNNSSKLQKEFKIPTLRLSSCKSSLTGNHSLIPSSARSLSISSPSSSSNSSSRSSNDSQSDFRKKVSRMNFQMSREKSNSSVFSGFSKEMRSSTRSSTPLPRHSNAFRSVSNSKSVTARTTVRSPSTSSNCCSFSSKQNADNKIPHFSYPLERHEPSRTSRFFCDQRVCLKQSPARGSVTSRPSSKENRSISVNSKSFRTRAFPSSAATSRSSTSSSSLHSLSAHIPLATASSSASSNTIVQTSRKCACTALSSLSSPAIVQNITPVFSKKDGVCVENDAEFLFCGFNYVEEKKKCSFILCNPSSQDTFVCVKFCAVKHHPLESLPDVAKTITSDDSVPNDSEMEMKTVESETASSGQIHSRPIFSCEESLIKIPCNGWYECIFTFAPSAIGVYVAELVISQVSLNQAQNLYSENKSESSSPTIQERCVFSENENMIDASKERQADLQKISLNVTGVASPTLLLMSSSTEDEVKEFEESKVKKQEECKETKSITSLSDDEKRELSRFNHRHIPALHFSRSHFASISETIFFTPCESQSQRSTNKMIFDGQTGTYFVTIRNTSNESSYSYALIQRRLSKQYEPSLFQKTTSSLYKKRLRDKQESSTRKESDVLKLNVECHKQKLAPCEKAVVKLTLTSKNTVHEERYNKRTSLQSSHLRKRNEFLEQGTMTMISTSLMNIDFEWMH
eukprot:MONOS_2263.1-p1 / transcript=MONOS_2263.1 / gene=MONOS_2263 / organism=Monocercomonoides_exilis_PA203 / gene_product=unspecified product / transcript_product=unspecified product / location=Mono_scaffold00045:146730-149285(-) / protein_length=852 / sequence_SO=supercontig / SO=protein_coding / is_pseudo=false